MLRPRRYKEEVLRKAKLGVLISAETDAALRDYARRHGMSIGEATDKLLGRALFGSLDEGTEAMLLPEIRKAVRQETAREVRDQTNHLLNAQTNRIAVLLVTAGREAAAAHRLAYEVLDYLTSDPQYAQERDKEAMLAAGKRFTGQHLAREATNGNGDK